MATVNSKKYVWYASYGSNMWKDRFFAYLKGGEVPMLGYKEVGCRDTSDPLDECVLILKHPTYFARDSRRWGGGPIFLDHTSKSPSTNTYSRLYLITEEQFDDITAQENLYPIGESFLHAREQAMLHGHYTFNQQAWYNTVIYLGSISSSATSNNGANLWPVFTFSHHVFQEKVLNSPSQLYLTAIVKGLKQMTGLFCVDHCVPQQLHRQQKNLQQKQKKTCTRI